MRLRLALMFMDGNFVGREYHHALREAGRMPELTLAAGRIREASVAIERERTGDLWSPTPIPPDVPVRRFESLRDAALWRTVKDAGIDIVIQGGVGILKPEMLAAPRLGFLNIHPGRLPQYRGNSCPEWALYNGDDIWATAHLIDAGIDTGPVICARPYAFPDDWDYFRMRANIYRHCASVMLEAIDRIESAGGETAQVVTVQDETQARYWPRIPDTELAIARANLPRSRSQVVAS